MDRSLHQFVPRVLLASSFILLFAMVYPSQAAITTYATRAAFNLDFPGLPLEDFEEARVPYNYALLTTDPLDSFTNDAVFHTGEIEAGLAIESLRVVPDIAALNNFGASTTKIVGTNTSDELIIRFSIPVDTVGLDVFVNWTPLAVAITPYSDTSSLGTFVRSASYSTPDFFGVVSDTTNITHLHMISQTGSARQVWVDNVAFGDTHVIPEPTGWVLVAIGLLTIWAVRWAIRRRYPLF